MIYNAFPTTTGEGEEVSINGTAEVPFKEIGLKGNTSQETTTGKNLCNLNVAQNSRVTINSDGTITINGNGGFTLNISKYNFKANTTYYMKWELVSGSVSFWQVFMSPVGNKWSEKDKFTSFTVDSDTESSGIWVHNNSVFTNAVIRIWFSETQSPFEPYTGGTASPNPDYPQEITNVTGDVEVVVQNKNLCNGINQGYYLAMNTSICGKSTGDNGLVIKVDGTSNYTVSTKATQTRFRVACLNSLPLLNGNVTAYNGANRDGASNSITINTNGYKYLIVNVTDLSSTQIEKGSTATPYTPHQEQVLPLTLGNIELCKIGDYQDYFYKSGSKWYLHKEIGKVVLDGTENWESRGTSTTLYQLAQTGIKHPTENNKKASLVSNFFETLAYYVDGTTDIFGNNNGISYPAIDNLLLIKNLSVNSLETFKAWLNEHNTKVYYTLATATNTEITDTTLIEQLDNLEKAYSYDTQTNISQTNQDKPFIISYEAILSLRNVLNDLITRVEVLESEV